MIVRVDFGRGYMTLSHSAALCVYCGLWLPVVACGCLWLLAAARRCLWLAVAAFGWLAAVCSCLWLPVAVIGCLLLLVSISVCMRRLTDYLYSCVLTKVTGSIPARGDLVCFKDVY